ncbi:MAG: tetraacyldisaccharide 4'-kinase [Alphaproteobacteria bacterium]|nr:tetraacyldisaccharide 4'-kinase [Alphaproteobacteria bacterium]
MPFKTPNFWGHKKSVWASILSPLSCLYLAGHRLNVKRQKSYTSSLPVICVGNIVAGGSGKTPAVISLVDLLNKDSGFHNIYILTRGYGGTLKGPTSLSLADQTHDETGDEARLLAHHAPVILSADRPAGAKLAELAGADLLIMDDGLQNPTLSKTLSFLVVDDSFGLGNGRLIPAGPLREPVLDTLNKTDAIILIGKNLPFETDKPVFNAQIKPARILPSNTPYIAFAGIGRPGKFLTTLQDIKVNLIDFHAYADHHPYSEKDIQKLKERARISGATLITTEKDMVRLSPSLAEGIETLPISLVFDDPSAVRSFIEAKIAK